MPRLREAGTCRCCLDAGSFKGLWKTYTRKGVREVYGDMLENCFSISIRTFLEETQKEQICNQCIQSLRDAQDFKQKVMESQNAIVERLIKSEDDVKDEGNAKTNGIADSSDYAHIEYLEEFLNLTDRSKVEIATSDTECVVVEAQDDQEQVYEVDDPFSFDEEREELLKVLTHDVDVKQEIKNEITEEIITEREQVTDSDVERSDPDANKLIMDLLTNMVSGNTCVRKVDLPLKKEPSIMIKLKTRNGVPYKGIVTKVKQQLVVKKPRKRRQRKQNAKAKAKMGKADAKKIRENDYVNVEYLEEYNDLHEMECDDIQMDNGVFDTTNVIHRLDIAKDTKVIAAIDEMDSFHTANVIDDTDFVTSKSKSGIVRRCKLKNEEPEEDPGRGYRECYAKPFDIDSTNPVKTRRENRKKFEIAVKAILTYTNATPFRCLWGKFVCAYCTSKFRNPEDLKAHTRKAHNAIRLKKISKLLLPNSVREIIRLDVWDLECVACHEPMDEWDYLFVHLEERHSVVVEGKQRCKIIPFCLGQSSLHCGICKESYNCVQSLEYHMNQHFGNYVCSGCGKQFMSFVRLKQHAYKEKKKRKILKCEICEMEFVGKYRYDCHNAKVHNIGVIPCKLCPESFHNNYMRQMHMLEKHQVKDVQCEDCGEKFNWPESLCAHYRTAHSNETKYACDCCEKSFNASNDERPRETHYTCDKCGSQFASQGAFDLHFWELHSNKSL